MADLNKIIEHPYLVYQNAEGDIVGAVKGHIQGNYVVRSSAGKIESALDFLYNQERKKETEFFRGVLSSPLPQEVKSQLQNLFDNKQYSQMATYLDAVEKGLADGTKAFKEVVEQLKSYYSAFTFKKDEARIKDFFAQYNFKPNQTFDKLFDDLIQYTSNSNDIKLQQQKDTIVKALTDLKYNFIVKGTPHFEKTYTFTKEDFTEKKYKNKKGESRTLIEFIHGQLKGMFGGKSGELAVGGAQTGFVTASGKNIDTDVIKLYSIDFTRDLDSEKSLQTNTVYEELQKAEADLIKAGGYAIHYSVKFGEGRDLKIKEEGSYLTRIEEIRDMLEDLDADDYTNFLFTFANTINGFIAQGEYEKVRISLIQFCMIWMFDDVIPNLSNEIESNNKALNFYSIRGMTVTCSELLNELKEYFHSLTIEGRKPHPAPVTITKRSFSMAPKDREAALKTNPMDPWQGTYKYFMNKAGIGLKMKGDNILKMVLEI